MDVAPSTRGGFTLVEILIVVVILGILATLVVPQFSNASDTSRATSTNNQLRALRLQLQLYRSQHDDQYPTLEQMWDNLVNRTDTAGEVQDDGTFGPYLPQAPTNVFTQSTSVVAVGSETAYDGWVYDESSGEITAVGFNEATDTYTAPN